MIWLEVISIRTAGAVEAGKVLDLCRQSIKSVEDRKLLKMSVFSNAKYETDISIHLQWKSDPGSGSLLGNQVRSALLNFGIISHTLWIEHEEFGHGEPLSTEVQPVSGRALESRIHSPDGDNTKSVLLGKALHGMARTHKR